MPRPAPGPDDATPWLESADHRAYLLRDARAQFAFFGAARRPGPGFDQLDRAGTPIPGAPQELHATTRMIHSHAIGLLAGVAGCAAMVDHGMRTLDALHRDPGHGGFFWSVDDAGPRNAVKLAYGHVFVLLAASSAKMAGHDDAQPLLDEIAALLDARFWDDSAGLFRDELARDWAPFSTYRGMNANMHGVEALLTAFEATGDARHLTRARRILDFFTARVAPDHGWRLPEHYTEHWQVDPDYAGDPMFRPAGTTPGHSFEIARLLLQCWDLEGRPADGSRERARRLLDTALTDAWDTARGGFVYTLDFDGRPAIRNRYWWPVTEAIGALAAFLKIAPSDSDEAWYRRLWRFADARLIDHDRGGWIPELAEDDTPAETQFAGKPDIYHAVQADLFPLVPRLSRIAEGLPAAVATLPDTRDGVRG